MAVMKAVMTLRQSDPTWQEAKRQLGDPNFITELLEFDKDNMTDKVMKKIGNYCSMAEFKPEIVGKVSGAAKSLCMWVRAMEVYGRIYRTVEPKRKVGTVRQVLVPLNSFFTESRKCSKTACSKTSQSGRSKSQTERGKYLHFLVCLKMTIGVATRKVGDTEEGV